MPHINDGVVRFERLSKPEKFYGSFYADELRAVVKREIVATGIIWICGHKCYLHRDDATGEYRVTEPVSGSWLSSPASKKNAWVTFTDAMEAMKARIKELAMTHEKFTSLIEQAIELHEAKNGQDNLHPAMLISILNGCLA
jgi:hypothetical protein